MTRRIAIVGGGVGGAAAALRAARGGAEVVLLERGERLGGLVTSFQVARTPLEMFYHHVFPHEREIAQLIAELGLGARLQWFRSSVAILREGRVLPFTGPLDLLRFSPLPFADRIRMGIGALRMGRERDWRSLDGIAARDWLRDRTSPRATEIVWDPMLRARFGSVAGGVPAAWMWGRFQQRAGARSGGRERLGYLRGGFAQLFDALEKDLPSRGVDLRLGAQVTGIEVDGGAAGGVQLGSDVLEADAVLYAGTLPGISRLVPAELADERWAAAEGLGAVCVILELARPLSDVYWTNVCDPSLPFGGIIEHTNLVPAADYGGRHVVYLSRYFTADDQLATADLPAEADRWIDALEQQVAGFSRAAVVDVHPFRTPYAAPLPRLGHLDRIPPMRSHIRGLILSTTAQIYPQDRGMNEGIRLATRAADAALAEPVLV